MKGRPNTVHYYKGMFKVIQENKEYVEIHYIHSNKQIRLRATFGFYSRTSLKWSIARSVRQL